MSKKKKIVFGGLGIVIILGIIIVLDARKGDASAIEVETRKVARGQVVQKVNATGRVQPAIEVDISANVAGEILELGVKEGDMVNKGQFLVRLDQERYMAAVERNESLQKSAAAEVKLARSELKRIRDLHEKGLSSEAELEQAEARLEKAVSAL
ncbi:MAG TPA: biotin/lipoyl-binding protein, partial [bacterium]|nr:biotin/lipoyl-binding protein [bacterium]